MLIYLQAPVSLASSLQEYLNDPNFEQNRVEYKASKDKNRNGVPSAQVPKGIVSANLARSAFAHLYSRCPYNLNEPTDYLGETPFPPSVWR